MNVYLFVVLVLILAGGLLFNIFKKSRGGDSKAPDIVTIVGLLVAVVIGIVPVFLSGLQAWTWHTTVLIVGCALVIGRILYSWRKSSQSKNG
ncbi:hypothetical protein ACFQ5D_22565 [Paenibacillus farraposensis]|uniref:Uncharacterized protein n=1 Tax=Paenibacillus farraposensis TaxID=2807095 RepID=A0ABW4DJQ8_9BACL|nr:hypothetical protein [Paenibacillus farraposensis]MCC3381087.1 hypothetical protein [Paenibacillus farraposensis]